MTSGTYHSTQQTKKLYKEAEPTINKVKAKAKCKFKQLVVLHIFALNPSIEFMWILYHSDFFMQVFFRNLKRLIKNPPR